MGVNNGGKHSVDVTYIARAEATGLAEVRTHTEVTDVERADGGTWKIHALFTDDSGTVLERHIITADAVIMGAGFGPVQGGPVVYGTKQWDDVNHARTVIQASMPGMGADIASTMMVGYGISDTRGSFRWDAASGQAELHWPTGGDGELIEKHIRPTADRIISAGGAKGMLTDTNTMVNSTWHSLGGACMGTVCDLEGRVKGQKGLYVLDGALIPGSTLGCNPSMTIAAVAERAMDRIVAQGVDRVF